MPGILFSLRRLHKTSRALSLDVVIGVLAMAVFAAKMLKEEISANWLLILALATWSFYTADHLLDAFKTKGNTQIFRHRLHYKYSYLLGILSVVSAIIAAALSYFFFETKIIEYGLFIGLMVTVYFVLLSFNKGRKWKFLQKEFIIALVYVAAIWLAPLVWLSENPATYIIFIICIMFLLTWAEGIMASYFDYDNDLKDGHTSFAIVFGIGITLKLLKFFHFTMLVILLILMFYADIKMTRNAYSILFAMNLILFSITLFPAYFEKDEKYRIIGEMVFWIPMILIFV
ncbi:MAG: hypothetical protein GXO88_02560 [Chlorobi bacterium]|nr:hypothetical protein [Chlorobiota bacterium]